MSSNRVGERRGVESWSLRVRLVVEQIALLTLVCVVIVVVTELALRAFLVDQLDDRLAEAQKGAVVFLSPPPPGGGLPPGIEPPGPAAGTFTAQIRDGVVRVAVETTSEGGTRELPSSQYAELLALPVDGEAHTRDLGALGEFRMSADQRSNGDVVITGLPTEDLNDTLLSVGLILGGVTLAGLLASAVGGALIVRRALVPLQRVAATASRVAELPLDRGEVDDIERVPARIADPRTEIGQVGLALNRMLGHVHNALTARHESETRVRQFVADASHELRTPLAAVRGYAELVRRRDDEVAPEVAHAIGRVESEARRMTTLVEDLLLLARLDSGRPLDSSTVDLSRLVVDVVSDARVAGPEHHWRLAQPTSPVTVTGDDARLHQVLANLLSNARTHTPAGTTVTTGLSTTDHAVTLTVTDDGPGIPADLLPEVFERFARGDSSRSRAAGSTGLGLAIVAAVVTAHDGTVSVRSRPGNTVFEVRLPAD
jgi:two-component system OmpR family sensor kinase